MSVVRVEKTKNYTVMSNYHLRDRNLSLKAKGLLSYMLSLPEDWDYSVNGLSAICKEGVSAIASTIRELEKMGYVTRSRIRNKNGVLGDVEYVVREYPESKNKTEEQPKLENPILEGPTLVDPIQENRAQINTNIKKELNKQTPYIQKHQEHTKSKQEIYKEELFNLFWRSYPRRVNKPAAIKAWNNIKPDEPLLLKMLSAIKKQSIAENWKDAKRIKFIPHPSSWLNGERWNDEVTVIYTENDDIKPEKEETLGVGPGWW